jgi:hypothetical protein
MGVGNGGHSPPYDLQDMTNAQRIFIRMQEYTKEFTNTQFSLVILGRGSLVGNTLIELKNVGIQVLDIHLKPL